MDTIEQPTKYCKHCNLFKSLLEFSKDKSRVDGYCYICKLCNRRKQKEYRSKVDCSKRNREAYLKNRKKYIENKVKYNRNRLDTDPIFRFKNRIRTSIRGAFRRTGKGSKKTKTENILGCSTTFFKNYIEQQFVDGMSWENMQLWHLDHIIPLAEANTEEDVIRLCHYTNYQPLWAIDNMRKGASRDVD